MIPTYSTGVSRSVNKTILPGALHTPPQRKCSLFNLSFSAAFISPLTHFEHSSR